jgi:capsular exopolysaccharide synthesis family protein
MSKFYETFTRMGSALTDAAIPDAARQQSRPQSEVRRHGSEAHAAPARHLHKESPESGTITERHAGPSSTSQAHPPLNGIRRVSVYVAAGSPVLPFDGTDEIAAERYRTIRTRLWHDPRNPRVICVSSSGVGDGKSVNAINLAGVLALKRENRVLLLDGDFRRSAIAAKLGVPNAPGLSDVLGGTVEWRQAVTQMAEAPNLYFMPAGEHDANPAELLDSTYWKNLCDTFREYFNFVIIDSPPIGAVTDTDLIQSVCDGVVLIARQDHSDRSRLLKIIESVPREKLIGVVINCVSPWMLWKTPDDLGEYAYGYKPASA